ncbi:MAG TPA: cytochrome c biogenesis protein CcdA [Bryobacteraceae bacterium]|nr:cytochrome c biogenesis protein CcdA [Bryobacteraceae bacterium]
MLRNSWRIGFVLLLAAAASAQPHYADWTLTTDPSSATVAPGGKVLLRAEAQIQPGWHLYAASNSPGTGIPASFQISPASLVDRVRILQTKPKRAFDKTFGADTETYESHAAFLLEVQLAAGDPAGPAALTVEGRFQTCSDTQCVPGRWSGQVTVNVQPGASAAVVIPAGFQEATPAPPGAAPSAADTGLAQFLLLAFGVGLACIFTPCVFPMIPITMSYFLNRQAGGKRDGVAQAVVFCLGIIVLFSGIGLLITALLGPFGIVQLGSNPWVNGFIAALFIAFGLSLLGAFEITIPSAILTKLNASSEKGGFVGTLLMGLTFSLASFACVGPFVGTLLAASVGSGGVRPLAGMVVFSTGLALPFFLLALFPSYLKKLPRSGGWMSRVKVVMGFIILAASLKYLSSLDQVMQWGFLTRERFLAAWIVLFAMAGLYLLGFVRLEGVKPEEPMGIVRLLLGMAFLVFAITLAPGMTGAPLGDLDAYVPAPSETQSAAGGAVASGPVWLKDQYREALDQARREGKLVLVDFTGYACANCHWMKANMFTRPEIASQLGRFVLVELYADGTDAVSEANQKLELAKFSTVAEPYYAILDPDEKVLATFPGLTRNAPEFLAFLNKGTVPSATPPATNVAGAPASEAVPPPTESASVPAANGAALPQFASPAPYAGKVLVVDFWATYCVPCIQEIPGFNKLQKDLRDKGVVVVGVAMDEEGAERVAPFLKKHPMQYQVALGAPALNQQFNLDALPVTVIFGRDGKQLKRFDGLTSEADLTAAVRAAL